MEYPKYVSERGIENLKQYKYNGVDNSLCARLFLNSFWEFVVSKVPTWVAPNILTLCGLGFITFGAFLSLVFTPTCTEYVPRVISFIYALMVFCYQTADNIDGKQARRTKAGSPLGELFDHGVDAIVMGLTMMMVSSVLHGGPTSSAVMSIFGIAAYWFSHWEEYHEGILIMGELTGPTELNIYEIVLYLITALFGSEIFDSVLWGTESTTVSCFLQVLFCVSSVAAIGKNVYGVYKCISEGRDAHGCTSFVDALKQTVFYVVFIVLSLAWVLLTPLEVEVHPQWFVFAVTMGAAYMSQRLITQRVCKEPIVQVKTPVIVMALLVLNSFSGYSNSSSSVLSSGFALFVAVVVFTGIEGIFAVSIIKQMCEILHIEPFRIKHLVTAVPAGIDGGIHHVDVNPVPIIPVGETGIDGNGGIQLENITIIGGDDHNN